MVAILKSAQNVDAGVDVGLRRKVADNDIAGVGIARAL
jgi:hypothetical protein